MIRVPPWPPAPLPAVIIRPNEHRFQLSPSHPRSPGRFLSRSTARAPRSAAGDPQRIAAQAMQDTTPADVDIIAAEEPDPDDPPRRADWHLAQAKKPYRGYPLASMQRHKTFSRPAECPRPRPPTGVSRVQRLAVWTPPLAEVLNDLFSLLVTNL